MKNLRAILVGLIAFSLAALPIGAAEMRTSMMGGLSTAAAHTECCPDMEHCEKQTENDCDQSSACAVKCSLIPATIVAGIDMNGPAPISESAVPVIDNLSSALEHPPLPPPRV